MAATMHSTASDAGRRRGDTFAAAVMTPELRADIHARVEGFMDEARRALDAAQFLIGFLDAADRPIIDMEPSLGWESSAVTGRADVGGYHQTSLHAGYCPAGLEDEGDAEASAQAATLNPSPRPTVTIHRPTEAEMRAAYIRTGGRVPRNLRRGLWQGFRA